MALLDAHLGDPARLRFVLDCRGLTPSLIALSRQRIVFDGHLGALSQHSHAVLGLLIGLEGNFRLATAEGTVLCRLAVVPASVEHELDFFGKRTLVLYVEPHVAGYGALHRGAGGSCLSLPALDVPWQRAVAAWQERKSCDALLTSLNQLLVQPGASLDPRIRKLCRNFNEGQLLDAPTAELARHVALSPSRLVHLFKTELGAGVRRVKQHYRFKLAVACIAQTRSLTSGAHSGGFADSGHFSRAFRGTFGVSPSEVLLRTTQWLRPHENEGVVLGS